jgi:hypothetical protein
MPGAKSPAPVLVTGRTSHTAGALWRGCLRAGNPSGFSHRDPEKTRPPRTRFHRRRTRRGDLTRPWELFEALEAAARSSMWPTSPHAHLLRACRAVARAA